MGVTRAAHVESGGSRARGIVVVVDEAGGQANVKARALALALEWHEQLADSLTKQPATLHALCIVHCCCPPILQRNEHPFISAQ